ncbi:CoA pyrophosphatase [Croceicoccus sp. BE223]|uniref:NUDIX hydrolase n=1 Tax=Croceicoccus sp. BE223 TaxID=2817716 RepID=UPI002864C304|nr:CoA pyrophosphatase [Croceicoccus sp. BE223]MDR7104005.1 8-oxo-dGTP pyrophosphatase MutT (NUDIX family) [Croceicoccus sp. BE223]
MSAIRHELVAMHRSGHARAIKDMLMDPISSEIETLRPAAVLVAVTERAEDDGNGPGIILIERPMRMRTHGGQVAFPGGAIDAGETPVQAALREANEEIGLPLSKVHVIGETDGYRTGTGFTVTPVLATIPPDLTLNPNPAEVDEWFEVPLSFAFDPANHQLKEAFWRGRMRSYVEFHWAGHRIWGATAGMIVNLSRRLHWAEKYR